MSLLRQVREIYTREHPVFACEDSLFRTALTRPGSVAGRRSLVESRSASTVERRQPRLLIRTVIASVLIGGAAVVGLALLVTYAWQHRGTGHQFGTGEVFLSMLYFFIFFIWIWLLIVVFSDIFRSDDLAGWAKALWVLLVIIVPYLGILVYLIARGGSMHERAMKQAQSYDQAAQEYIRSVAGTSSPTEELAKLNDLKSKGVIDQAEFARLKSKALPS